MSFNIAINGFGRIGRLAFRNLIDDKELNVVAINSTSSPEMLAHLLKYDSTQGRFKYADKVSYGEDYLQVGDKKTKIFSCKDANDLNWGELSIDCVLECSGHYKTKDKAQIHINRGAKKVIISSPAGNDVKTIVYNVNHKNITKDDTIISAASCTTNCLAPMTKVLNDNFPIKSGIMSTIHAYTSDQKLLDGSHSKGDLRRARAAALNIVPNTTGAAKAIGLVIPELNGKLIGSAERVPTPTGSLTMLFAVCEGKNITKELINETMKKSANETLGYTEEYLVSNDIVGIEYGSLFDATQTMVTKIDDNTSQVMVVAWYDNEMSYTCQMIRTIKYMLSL